MGPQSSPGYDHSANFVSQVYIGAGSIVRDAADETITLIGTSNDYNGYSRGASWDIGALEYGSVTTDSTTFSSTGSGSFKLSGGATIK